MTAIFGFRYEVSIEQSLAALRRRPDLLSSDWTLVPCASAPYSRSRDFDQSSICLSQSAISDFNKKLAYSV